TEADAVVSRIAEAGGSAEVTRQTEAPSLRLPDELRKVKERTEANLRAIDIVAHLHGGQTLSAGEVTALLQYSGWGGLSINKVAARLPEGWKPESRGLIHEYYTSPRVTAEVARVVRPLLHTLVLGDDTIRAVEPAAGVGR